MVNFQQFYRKHGIRTLNQLMTVNMFDSINFTLPMSSIVHWVDYEGILYGPSNTDLMFKELTKPVRVFHELELKGDIGLPRRVAYIPTQDIKDYHNKNKRTRWLRNIDDAVRDDQTVIVYNYTPLLKTTKYVKSYFSEYYKWYNIFSTVTKDIASICSTYSRNHFISMEIPKVIPSIQQLNMAADKGITSALLKIFNNKESYLLLELWKMAHPDETIRTKSLFNEIPIEKLTLVNIIFTESDKFSVLNLGYMYSFLTDSSNYPNIFTLTKQKIDFNQLQKRLLRLIISVMEVRTAVLAEKLGNKTEDIKSDEINAQNELSDVVLGPESDSKETPPLYHNLEVPEQDIADGDDTETEEDVQQRLKDEDLALDAELSQLNEIAKKHEEEYTEVKTTVKDILTDTTMPKLEDGVISVCDKLADSGMLSAAEYKRYVGIASAYKNIPYPLADKDSGKLLIDNITVTKEDTDLTAPAMLPDHDTVLDKTMLKSSLSKFTPNYVTKVLHKDIFNMVLNVQHSGVAVTDYKIEPFKDVLGAYDVHVIKLKPIIGKESTVRFRVPVIGKDGIFTASGVKYKCRMQRVDVPIRKIKPNEVALTSYYGKTFVNRGRRKVADYGTWLSDQIMAMAIYPNNNIIADVHTADVFYKDAKLPRAFTAISNNIKSFTCQGYKLDFDYSKRDENYPLDVVKSLEKHGSIIIGKNNKDVYLTMDMNNTVYKHEIDITEVLGTVEQFLSLDPFSVPVEYAEISVYGKSIPVGVVLSYYLGFDKLLKTLKIQYRRVPSNTRVNLAYNEWSIQFSDETLVFSRDDKLATMILGGFNSYHKAVKAFSVYSFDNTGVYTNLLEANGLSARFIREIDLMNKMFIDPITREILADMKEPLTFQGLLFRSCDLLLSDQHPDAMDPNFMRIRGYERISGAVYSELVQSLRFHEGRLGKAAAGIEMNPYAVWKRITEDPSKSLVNEINPIESLKESEAVTYAGTGGRNKRSMVKSTRAYHQNDMGTISEATVDSTDVSINVFTSANPQFTSLRGLTSTYNPKENGVTSLLSTTALSSVGATHDD